MNSVKNVGIKVATVALVAVGFGTLGLSAPSSAAATTCRGLTPTIVAEAGVPTVGTSGSDIILGTDGDDTLLGAGGADTLYGGLGTDSCSDPQGGSYITCENPS